MEIFALVGKSGTGKSYKAQAVAGMYGIEYIMDDGLLIKGTKVLAGYSAKRESTKIAAIRRAVFVDIEHKKAVMEAIYEYQPEKLLIIGTSEHMIEKILENLSLGETYNLIRIEEISDASEIERAMVSRRVKGKHVIPVPTFELKKDFSGYFIDSIKQLVRKSEKQVESYEKTVVRPTFSYLGKYEIKDGVIKSISAYAGKRIKNVDKINSVDILDTSGGTTITLTVSLAAVEPLYAIANRISSVVKRDVEFITGKNVVDVNVIVKSIRI